MSDCWKGKSDAAAFVPGVPERVARHRTLRSLLHAMRCCTRCDLATERTRVVPGVGPADARVMLIGEGPGAQEDRKGVPFVGRAGSLLDELLAGAGLSRESVFITNTVACRPPRNRAPRVREVAAHAPWLDGQLRLVSPRVVCTLGRSALVYFRPGAKITELHGAPLEVDVEGRTLTLLPTFHPAAALRRRELIPTMRSDLRAVRSLLDRS